MNIVALVVVAAWIGISLWAWRRAPGRQAAEAFTGIWRVPWGKQFFVDFFGLGTIPALWMLTDGAARGTWALSLACIAAMPIFGALPAALYWLAKSL